MAYTGVYVFGDSLVDAGNALKLAQWYGTLTFSDLPEGAPTSSLGYFQGRFSNGYTFADLISNKVVALPTKPVFPFGYEDPWLGIPVAPFASDPSGKNLNFAYGGAQVRQGDEVVPDLDGQTDAFKDAVDNHADPNALYIFTFGGNDIRNLAPDNHDPVTIAAAHDALDEVASQMIHEISQLIAIGVRNIMITGLPDVGLIPEYDRDGNMTLDAVEQSRAAAATEFSLYLDALVRAEVVPALQALGATVTFVPLMDGMTAGGAYEVGVLNAIMPTLAALHGLTANELSTNLLQHQDLVFFDQIHPTAQVHALVGAYSYARLNGTAWVETLPLMGSDVDYRATATIGAVGEVDRYSVMMIAGSTYTLEMLGISSLGMAGNLADTMLRLIGPSGTLLAYDDDSGAGFDSCLTINCTSTGSYTLELSGVGAMTGSYALQGALVGGAAQLSGNTYAVANASTIVLEGAGGLGQDVIKASASYALAQGSEIEVLRTGNDHGKTAINLTGNEFGQAIVGNNGANIVDGKGGADVLTGGGGKDVFVLGDLSSVDRITDYGTGDVVDVSALLKVAGGTNVVAAQYVRVTTNGLIQLDLDGGGDEWAAVGSINGNGAVTIRYGSGSGVADTSVARVADSAKIAAAVHDSLASDSELDSLFGHGSDAMMQLTDMAWTGHEGARFAAVDIMVMHPDAIPAA